jgi:hypothetical protein
MNERVRRAVRRVQARSIYKADQFLGYPPLVQVLVVVGMTALLVVGWGLLARVVYPNDPDLPSTGEDLWWSVTQFMDGGTMAGSPPHRRGLALGATICGALVMSFLTGAFASKMAERIGDLKSGKSPVVEEGHLVVLGFDSKVTFLARELARSGQRLVVAIMSTDDKERIEQAVRPAKRVPQSRARFIARTGDPRSELALLRISADKARAIVIVPPAQLDDEATVSWALSTMLAVRRVVGPKWKGHVVVEARHRSAEDILRLAAEPDVAGPGALPAEVVASDDVIARVLAQAARQEGVYFALREMLSFLGSEIYLEPVGHRLAGRTFDEVHERLRGGVALGIVGADGETRLAPPPGDPRKLGRRDRLAVLAHRARGYHLDGKFAPLTAPPNKDRGEVPGRERVLLLGYNRTLPLVIEELDEILADGSEVTVMCCPIKNPVRQLLETLESRVSHVRLSHDARRPVDLVNTADDALLSMDAVVVLGCEDENDENGDADALSTLLWLRHAMRRSKREVQRVVTEVRDVRSAEYVRAAARDLLVSSDVVAMLLAQSALEPEVARIYRELLSPIGHEIFLRPRGLYVGEREASFGEVMAAARVRGEVAIGLYPAPPGEVERSLREQMDAGELGDAHRSPLWLNPPRTAAVPMAPQGFVVVLSLPERPAAEETRIVDRDLMAS